MTVGHAHSHHSLFVRGQSPIHSLAAEAKLAGLVAFVIVVALTPRRSITLFVVDALVVIAIISLARLRPRVVLVRLAAIIPFISFAALLPFIGDGERIEVGVVSLSVDGLWASWNIVAKATLGATASIVLTATTPIPDILRGLARLRVPAPIVGIIGFMFRYLDLVSGELARMRQAMVARGHDPRWLWQARPIAASAGTLFVRTYERGERVHDAMAARGFTGTMPQLDTCIASRRDWLFAVAPAAIAAAAAAIEAMS